MNRRQLTQLQNSGSRTPTLPNIALRIPAASGHVSHGYFWEAGKAYGKCFWDALVRPYDTNGNGYLISAGYGGAHCVLLGFDSTDTTFSITGNIWSGAANVSYSSPSVFKLGDWVHIAFAWDGVELTCYVNGVCEGMTAHVAASRSTPDNPSALLYVGGSNHSKFDMDVAWVRGFEGLCPITSRSPFRPTMWPSSTYFYQGYTNASFLADYTVQQRTIADLSNGLTTGICQVETNTVVAAAGITSNGNARSIVTANGMTGSPKTVTVPVTIASHTTASLIATAFRTALAADADVTEFFYVGGTAADITLTTKIPQPNDSTMNFTIEDVTSAGITEDVDSTNTTAGYLGEMVRHPGVLEGLIGSVGNITDPNLVNSPDSQKPYWVEANFSQPTHDTEAVPGGAIIYDGFNRHSSHLWADTPTLGSTEGGSAGIKSWTNATSYGCSYGRAYPVYSSPVIAHVDSGTQTMSVRLGISNGTADLYTKYTDSNNYIIHQASGAQHTLTKVIAGASTQLYTTGAGASATSLRIDTSGSNITLYINGSQVYTTSTTLPTGTRAGFAAVTGSLCKITSFEIQPA